MYFSSLKDDELDYFHKTINASFTMSLTDILGSDLFKVDEVVEDVLYRIYPLFYCTNAISSNPKDKILDNKCFICTVGEHETYMSFTKGESDNLIIDESSMTLYDIGDSLSADEFNAMVYSLRSKEVLTGKLNFEESNTLTGLYGTYTLLHTENQPRNDYGYIINDNVKDNPLTVKLTNPFFDSANYKLTFTVKSITGVNVFDETSEQYVDTDELTITLTEDEEVAIDLTEYTNDSVLLYNVSVEVDFKTAEKQNSDYELILTSAKTLVEATEPFTLTATLTSTDAGVTGYNVQFYDGDTLLDTVVTDNNGEASITISSNTVGIHNYNCKAIGVTSTITVQVATLTLTINNPSPLFTGNSCNDGVFNYTIEGIVKLSNEPVTNATIDIKENNVLIDQVVTDEDGVYTKTLSKTITSEQDAQFTNTYEVKYTSEYNVATKNTTVTPSHYTMFKNIEAEVDGSFYVYSELYSLSKRMLCNKLVECAVLDSQRNVLASASKPTNSNGATTFGFDESLIERIIYVRLHFDGDDFYYPFTYLY